MEPAHTPDAVGRRLRLIMADAGVTPPAVAILIGATELQVVDWMEGRVLPPIQLMNRLANRCGLTLGYIYHGDESGLLPGIAARLGAAMKAGRTRAGSFP